MPNRFAAFPNAGQVRLAPSDRPFTPERPTHVAVGSPAPGAHPPSTESKESATAGHPAEHAAGTSAEIHTGTPTDPPSSSYIRVRGARAGLSRSRSPEQGQYVGRGHGTRELEVAAGVPGYLVFDPRSSIEHNGVARTGGVVLIREGDEIRCGGERWVVCTSASASDCGGDEGQQEFEVLPVDGTPSADRDQRSTEAERNNKLREGDDGHEG